MAGRKITDGDRKSVGELVEHLGGLASAPALLGMGKGTLTNCVSGKADTFGGRVWEEKLSKFAGKTREEVLSQLAKEMKALRKSAHENETLRDELRWLESEKEYGEQGHQKLVAEIKKSPFTFLELYAAPHDFTYDFTHSMIHGLLDEVKLVAKDQERPLYQMYAEMIRFSQFYELFRPSQMSRGSSHYFGTVGALDGVYDRLFSYIGLPPSIRFSRRSETMQERIFREPSRDHASMEWPHQVRNLEEAVKAVELTMREEAFRLMVTLRGSAPSLALDYAIQYVLSFDERLSPDRVEQDRRSPEHLLVFGRQVRWEDRYEMGNAIKDILEEVGDSGGAV
jgi:hypothetical protein